MTLTGDTLAQTTIRNLVFEGAGIRGIAYAGAIKELEQRNILKDVQRVGGTSSGAIVALLLSIGYTSNEISAIVSNTPYQKFNDGRFFFIGGINRVNKYSGWYFGKHFEQWLAEKIKKKVGDENITFLQLKQKGYKDLYVTGTCLNKQSLIVFSYETYPNMKVKDAIRVSMSIPIYYEPVYMDASGNVVHHPKNKAGLDVMLDGGFIANFPIKIFDSTRYFNLGSTNKFAPNPETIGFRIDREDQIEKDQKGSMLAPMEINSLKEYIGAFYNIIIENLNRQTLTKEDWQRTVSISDGNVGPRVRKLTGEEVDVLIYNGTAGTKHYFANNKQ
ncbi:MAG: patatin-like phospholipase family protein [Flavisolibacter sp.]